MAYFPNALTSSSSLNAANLTGTIAAISGVNITVLSSSALTGALPAISGAALTAITASVLTGALPAISGAALTSLTASALTGALPAISGASLTSLTASALTGALPAISGASLTSLNASNITSGVIPNAQVNWAAPSAIGSTTANTAAFTTLSTSGILTSNAGRVVEVTTVTTTATLGDNDYIVIANSSTPFTITLPTATSHVGRTYRIKSIGTGVVTLSRASTDLIDGAVTQTLNQYQSIDLAAISTSAWAIL